MSFARFQLDVHGLKPGTDVVALARRIRDLLLEAFDCDSLGDVDVEIETHTADLICEDCDGTDPET